MIRVLIVEDQKLTRETMERTVRDSETYELAGSLFSAELSMTFCLRNQGDLILSTAPHGYRLTNPTVSPSILRPLSQYKPIDFAVLFQYNEVDN